MFIFSHLTHTVTPGKKNITFTMNLMAMSLVMILLNLKVKEIIPGCYYSLVELHSFTSLTVTLNSIAERLVRFFIINV